MKRQRISSAERFLVYLLFVVLLFFFFHRNGSVKVRFRVIVKVDKRKEKEPSVIVQKVGKTLGVKVKEGKLGNYKVKPVVEFEGW